MASIESSGGGIIYIIQSRDGAQKEMKLLIPKEKIKSGKVCIVGLGYVGLPLAEAFSKHLKVTGYDIDEEKIKKPEQQ